MGATRARVPETGPIEAHDFIWHLVFTQRHRHPEDDEAAVTQRFARNEVVLIDGTPVTPNALLPPGTDVYFYRRPAPETPVPYEIETIYEDENIMVVNKPPFLATMPRASHITENVAVRLRRATGNDELTPAHRLDRMTSGLLLLTKRQEVRGVYQQLFAQREVCKVYEAVADDIGLRAPIRWEHAIEKKEGELAARILPDAAPNAVTTVSEILRLPEYPGTARYLLHPVTGRTHQLRAQMNHAGAPIHGDPVYPTLMPAEEEDFDFPMLLASVALGFHDPLQDEWRHFIIKGWSRQPVPETVLGD